MISQPGQISECPRTTKHTRMTTQNTPIPHDSPVTEQSFSGICALTHLGVIRVTGADARTFLQGQLTQDVLTLGEGEARLAAFCNAKGRMQASFTMLTDGAETILLVCSRDLLAATRKRLSMFVLRAKATLSDATDELMLYGLLGNAAQSIASEAVNTSAETMTGTKKVVVLPSAAGVARALWVAPKGTVLSDGEPVPLATWQWLEVQSGIATVTQPIFEALVPQMLNYESIGGVNFKKGCYPGQEIVARSQFRGTLKRRTYLVHTEGGDGSPLVGAEVFHAADASQPCGLVAACAPHPAGGFDALVSMQTAAADDAAKPAGFGRLTLGAPDGPVLSLLPLPYVLLDDI